MAAASEKGTTSSAWIVLGGQVTSVRLFAGIESTCRRVHLTTGFTCKDALEARSAFAHGARGLVRCNRMSGGATPPTLPGRC